MSHPVIYTHISSHNIKFFLLYLRPPKKKKHRERDAISSRNFPTLGNFGWRKKKKLALEKILLLYIQGVCEVGRHF